MSKVWISAVEACAAAKRRLDDEMMYASGSTTQSLGWVAMEKWRNHPWQRMTNQLTSNGNG
jgi:hypothetical protein